MPVTKSQVTTPRKRGRPRTSSAEPVQGGQTSQPGQPSAVTPMSADAKRRWEDMNSFLQIGVAVSVFTKNYADAGAIAYHGPNFTKALARQADTNEKLAKILDYLGAIGPYSELLTAALPLALQFAANHKKVPAEAVANFGVMPPRMLETKVKLEIKQAEAALMQQLKEQEAQIEEMELTIVAFQPPVNANGTGRTHAGQGN